MMSEPALDYFIERIKIMLREIDSLVDEPAMTNSKREIIKFNTNEIELNLYIIMRKLIDEKVPDRRAV